MTNPEVKYIVLLSSLVCGHFGLSIIYHFNQFVLFFLMHFMSRAARTAVWSKWGWEKFLSAVYLHKKINV